MIRKTTLLFATSVIALTGCSTVGDMFKSKDEKSRLEGKRISVLELQRSLAPDSTLNGGDSIIIPQAWNNDSWPQAGGLPSHTLHHVALNTNMKQIWSTSIGRGSKSEIPLNAQPVVAEGKIFALDTNFRVSAFNALNGKRLWDTKIENDEEDEDVISGGLSYGNGMLYATNGYDEILALSPENGEILWRKKLSAPSRSAPTIANGRLFITTIDSRLIALDAQSGQGLWEYAGIGETTGLLGAASAGANNDIVVPVFSSGEVTALRVENGSVAWSDNLASVHNLGSGLISLSDIKAMPIVDRGMIISISFSGKMAAIDERTGTRIWQKEISGTQTPWIAGDTIYVLSSENQLIALNRENGGIYWIKEIPSYEDMEDKEDPIHWSGPILAGEELILSGSHGMILTLNPKNGDIQGTIKTKKSSRLAPIVANNTLYLLSDDGTLSAYQ